jgi:hypothetical protein
MRAFDADPDAIKLDEIEPAKSMRRSSIIPL